MPKESLFIYATQKKEKKCMTKHGKARVVVMWHHYQENGKIK